MLSRAGILWGCSIFTSVQFNLTSPAPLCCESVLGRLLSGHNIHAAPDTNVLVLPLRLSDQLQKLRHSAAKDGAEATLPTAGKSKDPTARLGCQSFTLPVFWSEQTGRPRPVYFPSVAPEPFRPCAGLAAPATALNHTGGAGRQKAR